VLFLSAVDASHRVFSPFIHTIQAFVLGYLKRIDKYLYKGGLRDHCITPIESKFWNAILFRGAADSITQIVGLAGTEKAVLEKSFNDLIRATIDTMKWSVRSCCGVEYAYYLLKKGLETKTACRIEDIATKIEKEIGMSPTEYDRRSGILMSAIDAHRNLLTERKLKNQERFETEIKKMAGDHQPIKRKHKSQETALPEKKQKQ
jgi:hypothetical protein